MRTLLLEVVESKKWHLENIQTILKQGEWLVVSGASLLPLCDLRISLATQMKNGYFEILICNKTVSVHGIHLHIAVADSEGKAIGGHLMYGCRMYTTAEILIAQSRGYVFTRVKDVLTKFTELYIEQKLFCKTKKAGNISGLSKKYF